MSGEYETDLRPRPNFPTRTIVLTIVVLLAIVVSRYFISEINDLTGIAPDVLTVFSILIVALLFLIWAGWFLFLSKWNWIKRILSVVVLFGIPIGLILILRPVTGGDMSILRIDPIWNSQKPPAELTESPASVDLSPESLNDFPGFWGPNRNGIVNTGYPIDRTSFTSGTRRLWLKSIGEGWSGFVARNGFAITMEQRGADECVTCYEIATGKLLWIYRDAVRHRDMMNLGHVGPRATPMIYDGKVYCQGTLGKVVCLDGKDGSLIWQANLNDILNLEIMSGVADGLTYYYEPRLAWGRAGSPLVTEQLVIVPGGGSTDEQMVTLVAFDRLTGEVKWKGGNEMIAYGSPSLANIAGKEQVIITAENKTMGFDLETGKELWSHDRPGNSSGDANTSQPIVYDGDKVLITKGYGAGGELIKLIPNGDSYSTETLPNWPNGRILRTKMTSPIIFEGHAYCLMDGFLECSELESGRRKWKHRGQFGHGQILLKDGLLLVHSETGELFLIEPSPSEYTELGHVPTIEGICWNTICLSGPYLLVKSDLEAACLQLVLTDTDPENELTTAQPKPADSETADPNQTNENEDDD